jgi:hypothetical protein
MTVLLNEYDSVGKCLMFTFRHRSLCNRIPGGKKYAEAIVSHYMVLEDKIREFREVTYHRLHCRDLLEQHNQNMDDGVRTVYEKCKQHDRENPDDQILSLVFPETAFGPYVRNNIFKEPAIVEQLVVRLESLGKEHPMYAVAGLLKKPLREMRKAILAFREGERHEKIAKTERDLSKGDLVKQYRTNYFDACKDLGKKKASQLFPRTPQKKTEPVPGLPADNNAEAA